jgi:hypothetical protein
MQTSISDYEKYKNICLEASNDDKIFNNFKNHPEYVGILEHVSHESGLEYLQHILNTNKLKLDQNSIDIMKKIDFYGNPKRFNYDIVGDISPTMLRYFSILGDIDRLYGSLDDKKIVEIGAGYGGQSMMIHLMYNVKQYIIVDLPEVVGLIKKFLEKNNIDMSKYMFYTLDNLPNIYSDFAISNYAFSECYKEIQDIYIDKIINRSKNFYMIVNFISDTLVYNKEQLLERLNGNIQVYPETPTTTSTNLLFYKG